MNCYDDNENLLLEYCSKNNIDLSSTQQYMLKEYVLFLQKWNKHYNLTAISDIKGIITYHLIDSISTLPFLDAFLKFEDVDICDVGSGAGLPGVIISIMRPKWNVVCVDSIGKKTVFMNQVGHMLDLSNLSVIKSRIELLNNLSFDLIISRAFSSLKNFTKNTKHLLKANGIFCAMKGKMPKDEIFDLLSTKEFFIDKVEILNNVDLVTNRCLVFVRNAKMNL
ncbi:16S rRNA (guanine(527)-N(7))-methyltransferase RsmG [Candidatus Kinetoplastidibacterium crithidiae]|uniref:Ribosomal RNA small subunit methyltransferase G n=1 Tax=Candidatus Kinetoplastidibacterium crithidiae TCC036E TaxID=1208918 RepID=M1LVA5_9PROT|nr:16S rRNA (guanine(527)-N(7))-methyltransferase RsmG [Candidatus Kinetoplastibacterium crithidii]AFZ83023.1 16S rRNA (guanine527-N7)-methyltransferase [Candidatus Kinetoplastibacterium crithidii (ex Angomonas deanei ATCC 30255)]AGF48026.1 glucose inhibited division protein B [Candidatus Kinetoplastibacterium crithidii TCC036E]